jgi:hypothetical protein
MNSFMRDAALCLFAFPAWSVAQTTQDASRIGGSIYPTVIRPAPLAPPRLPNVARAMAAAAGAQGITAVCLGSQGNAAQCQASLPGALPSAQVAFCDVQDIGLGRCLSRYATGLVKLPEAATRTLSFLVRDAQGTSSMVIVLATADQSEKEVAAAALDGKPGGRIVALRMPTEHPLAEHAVISP